MSDKPSERKNFDHEHEIEASDGLNSRYIRSTRKSSLPSPAELESLNAIQADFADRAFRMAEKAQDSRIADNKAENQIRTLDAIRDLAAPVLSFIAIMGFGAMSCYIIAHGHEISGSLLLALDIGGVFAAYFLHNKR